MLRREFVAVLSLLTVGATLGLVTRAVPAAPPATQSKTVRLIVDYGDGVEKHFTAITWKNGMTVFEALGAAAAHTHGITMKYRGKGATLFVERIDDLKNEGHGNNWTFRVNGRLADRSCGIQTVKAGDAILWRFGKYR